MAATYNHKSPFLAVEMRVFERFPSLGDEVGGSVMECPLRPLREQHFKKGATILQSRFIIMKGDAARTAAAAADRMRE
ncbi:MAG: hypothetical protein K2Z81_01910 [Cyanobacteria bacterium]|nr:hypothetical protein [Cyanobacteriota bacterium]